jgi:hypothetical protein
MSDPRSYFAGAPVRGGVLVVGGLTDLFDAEWTGSAEVFDLATETWDSVSPITPSYGHTATVLAVGRSLSVEAPRRSRDHPVRPGPDSCT